VSPQAESASPPASASIAGIMRIMCLSPLGWGWSSDDVEDVQQDDHDDRNAEEIEKDGSHLSCLRAAAECGRVGMNARRRVGLQSCNPGD
jgi:hypothetical protein